MLWGYDIERYDYQNALPSERAAREVMLRTREDWDLSEESADEFARDLETIRNLPEVTR